MKRLPLVTLVALTWFCHPLARLPAEPPVQFGATTNPVCADATLCDAAFVDREYGWVVGEHGTIWHTDDGGQHWRLQHTGTDRGMHGVWFANRKLGWAVGGQTRPYLGTSQAVLLHTSDGGRTWQQQLALLPALEKVRFFDAVHGIAWGRGSGSDPLGVFVSDDGGRNWRPFGVGPRSAWWGGDFLDPRGGVVVGAQGQLAELAHGDAMPVSRTSATNIHAVRFGAEGTGWAVGADGLIMRSDDAGKTWQEQDVLPADLNEAITWNSVATAGSHVWIAGSPGTVILHSPNDGESWQGHSTGSHAPIHKLVFVDDSLGWAVGALGTILHTTDGGQTWALQQQGGARAAVLVLASSENHLPLATLAKLNGDGYRTVVHLFAGSDDVDEPDHYARVAEALTNLGCSSVTRSTDISDPARIAAEIARQVRIWRPSVVIGPDAGHGPMIDRQIATALDGVVNTTTENDRLSHLTEQLALPAWQASRVFAHARDNTRGTHRVEYTAALAHSGQTLAGVATAAKSLFVSEYEASPETDEFLLKASLTGEPTAAVDDLVAGLGIAEGSDCRRTQLPAPAFDAQVARRLAEKRRNVTNIFRFAEGNPALLAQVGQMMSDLDETAAAALLFELSAQFRQTGQTQLAADTLNLLARRFPNSPVTDQALTWLVQFYASGETAHAYRAFSEPAGLSRRDEPAGSHGLKSEIVPATALLEDRTAQYSQQRYTHAVQLVEHIAQTRPLLYAEPQVRVSWAMAERKRNSADAADRYLASLGIRYPGEAWQECGAVEQWLADRTRPVPTKPRVDCRFSVDKPTLDGVLNEKCWQSAITSASQSPITNRQSQITFAYDEQYLYVAVRCDKLTDLAYTTEDRPRTYDADLREHDRMRILLDVDRDYTTYFALTIDHRGFTNDSCWGDSSWNPKWFVAPGGDEQHWTAEAAIPWVELVPVAPTTGAAWAVSCERILPPPAHESGTDRVSPRDFSVLLLK